LKPEAVEGSDQFSKTTFSADPSLHPTDYTITPNEIGDYIVFLKPAVTHMGWPAIVYPGKPYRILDIDPILNRVFVREEWDPTSRSSPHSVPCYLIQESYHNNRRGTVWEFARDSSVLQFDIRKSDNWVEPGFIAMDSSYGDLTDSVEVNGTVNAGVPGTYILNYSVTNSAGKKSSVSRSVKVMDSHSVELNSSVSLEMEWIPRGDINGTYLGKGFYLGRYEVTQEQYEAVMKGFKSPRLDTVFGVQTISSTPSYHRPGYYAEREIYPNRPVENVSFRDISVFLSRLNDSERASGRLPQGWSYDLPLTNEIIYVSQKAARSSIYENLLESGINSTRDVGSYPANPAAWNIYDLFGNVGEWLRSSDSYLRKSENQPVLGGGFGSHKRWINSEWYWSYQDHMDRRKKHRGFRLAFRQVD
jgi:hypothetical protein